MYCSESSVLDAITVVTVTSYNFPAGVKQHGSLVRFFVDQYEEILFRGVYFVFSFSYQIIIQEFQILRAEERTFGGKIFSVSLVSLNRISPNNFLDFSVFFSRSLNQHQHFTNIFRSVLLVSGFAIWWYQCYSCGLHPFPAIQYFQDSRFMTCLCFRIFTIMFFLSFFLLIPKRLNKACARRIMLHVGIGGMQSLSLLYIKLQSVI